MMKKWIFFPLFLMLFSCKGKNTDTYFTPAKATWYFREVEKICNQDNGNLWGKNLYGAIMYVDRTSRKIISNQPDQEGLLKFKNGVYTGLYPREQLVSNAPAKFGGKLFALVPLPDQEDTFRINTRTIHSLFHKFQQNEGINSAIFNPVNMDEKQARLWIKLEWKALRKALNSEGAEQNKAIRDALIFRGANRESYPKFAAEENRFESYEGLATFTYTLLCTNTREEFRKRLFETLDRIYSVQSYARSYGFIHGALYATLLHDKGYDMRNINTAEFDLGGAVKNLYNIELPPVCRNAASSIAVNYDIDTINKEEEQRDADIKKSVEQQLSNFTEKPVVFIELESPYFDFEPEDVHSLDSYGTLYNSIRISDNWGKLTVEKGGCLISGNLKYIRVPATGFSSDKNRVSGEGWHLLLNNEWELVKVEQNYFLRKLMP